MNRGHRNCEICGTQEKQCSDKVFFARFPSREHICKQWVKVVGKEDLLYLPIEKLHDLRYVCGRHFENRYFTKSKTRLKKNAVPTLQLTEPPLRDELLEGFPLHTARKYQGLHPPAEMAPEQQHQNEIATKSLHPPAETAPEQQHQNEIATKTAVSLDHVPVANKTRKRPLATSSILNTNVPGISSISSAFSSAESVTKRIKLSEADLNPREIELLQQLKKTKA